MDNNHHKPTSEELEAQIRQTQEELDKMTAEPTEETPSVEEPQEEQTQEPQAEPEQEAQEEESKEEVKAVEEEKPAEKEIDYKEKFSNSSREALILAARNKKMNEAIEQADSLPMPTDDELGLAAYKAGFNLDDMSTVEKELFRKSIHNENRLAKISEVAREGKDIDEWNQKVDGFIEDPKTLNANPDLEGKTEQFKVFAMKESRRGVDFDTLVSSFLYTVGQERKPNKGQMFEVGTGGPNTKVKPKSDKISVEEGARLMETNYAKYRELLKAGKIATE